MSTLAGDFWVCGDCRSINNAGAKQCYNCRTPKDRAAVDPETIDPSTHGKLREIELPPFRPSRGVATLATVGIVAIAVMQAYNTFITASVIQLQIDGSELAPNQLAFAGTVGIITLGVAALALIGWSLWLSRVVTAMPALGLGYPAADGFMAFVENFLPGLNLYRVPAIVRDVVHRLEPGSARGEAVIFGSWLALLGGVLVPRIGAAVTGTTLQSGPDALRTAMLVAIVASVFVAIGAVGLITLIWWMEGQIVRRRAAQLADAPASAQSPHPAAAASATEPLATRSAFAAAATSTAAPAPAPTSDTPSTPRFSLPQVEPEPPPEVPVDDTWAQITAQREEAARVGAERAAAERAAAERAAAIEAAAVIEAAPVEPPPVEAPPIGAAPVEAAPVTPPPVEAPAHDAVTVEPSPEPPAVAPATEATATPVEESAPVEPQPAQPSGPTPTAEDAPAPPEPAGPPHLTIKVGNRGMITAEMDGEAEHVILDDLTAYADALAKVGGTAAIHTAPDDSMAGLIARRAQRILDDAGVQVTVD